MKYISIQLHIYSGYVTDTPLDNNNNKSNINTTYNSDTVNQFIQFYSQISLIYHLTQNSNNVMLNIMYKHQ